MSFKIVQTREKGCKGPVVTVVPMSWERNNILYWPPKQTKKQRLEELIRDPFSAPNFDWTPMPCTQKRENFLVFESAEAELNEMLRRNDSDAAVSDVETRVNNRNQKQKKHRMISARLPAEDFNHMIPASSVTSSAMVTAASGEGDELKRPILHQTAGMTSNNKVLNKIPGASTGIASSQPMMDLENGNTDAIPEKNDNWKLERSSLQTSAPTFVLPQNHSVLPSLSDPSVSNGEYLVLQTENADGTSTSTFLDPSHVEYVLTDQNFDNGTHNNDNQSTIIKLLKTIANNQQQLSKELDAIKNKQNDICTEVAHMKTTLDYILSNGPLPAHLQGQQVTVQERPTLRGSIFPIVDKDVLDKMETKFLDIAFANCVVKEMSAICGTTGKLNWADCCLTLVDHFLTRDLLAKFSWGGGSRDEEQKWPFKIYRNTMAVFYNIIVKADMNCSEMDIQMFFKGIVKNAKRRSLIEMKRAEGQPTRASSAKRRPRKLKYTKVQVGQITDASLVNGSNSRNPVGDEETSSPTAMEVEGNSDENDADTEEK